MNKTFTFAEIAREAIKKYGIKGNEQTRNTISKQISRYIQDNYDKGTKITEEIKEKIFHWDELGKYFKGMGDANWKGGDYYEDLAVEMTKKNEEWIQEQISSDFQNSTIKDIENEINQDFEYNRIALIDKIMFKTYLFTNDNDYKEDYKIIAQNNFSKKILTFAKEEFFNKYFDTKLFLDDFINYFNRYENSFNVRITPEMAESVERLEQDNNYKEYFKKQ